tara:strand:+ start:5162 stop:6385 length:1224 start_codon:yes stop_codon:yes gene_type:complete
MTTILVIHPDEQHSYYTASALSSVGYEVFLLTGRDMSNGILISRNQPNPKRKYKIVELAPYMYLMIGLLRRILRGTFLARRAYEAYVGVFNERALSKIKQLRPDAIVVYDTLSGGLLDAIVGVMDVAPKLIVDMSAPLYSAYLHDSYDSDPKKNFRRELVCDGWRLTNSIIETYLGDIFITASRYTSKGLQHWGVSSSKIRVVPYGNKFKSDLGNRTPLNTTEDGNNCRKKLNILYVGNVSTQKGVHRLLSAVSKINSADAEYRINLTLVGDTVGTTISIDAYPWLTMAGRLDSSSLQKMYQDSSAFVFPSLSDGFGFVVLEALSFGIPVFCSEYSGASDLINESNGVIFDPRDTDKFPGQLDSFLRDVSDGRYRRSTVALSVKSYTWETYGLTLAAALENKGVSIV